MHHPDDFTRTMREGKSAGTKHLAVHFLADQHHGRSCGLVGFVVPKKEIAHATDRNRLRRQLRHIIATDIKNNVIGASDNIVVRVFSPANNKPSEVLQHSFHSALSRAQQRFKEATHQ